MFNLKNKKSILRTPWVSSIFVFATASLLELKKCPVPFAVMVQGQAIFTCFCVFHRPASTCEITLRRCRGMPAACSASLTARVHISQLFSIGWAESRDAASASLQTKIPIQISANTTFNAIHHSYFLIQTEQR